MKIRDGFVSNSSSSSFVVVGYKTKKSFEELEEIEYKNTKMRICVDSEYFNNYILFGVYLDRWSDGDNPDVELTIDEIQEKFEEVKKIGKEAGITEEPKIYVGTTYC